LPRRPAGPGGAPKDPGVSGDTVRSEAGRHLRRARGRRGGGGMNTRAYSVLIVDDDAMVRGWLRMSLQGSEFTIAGEAATAAQATELAERRRPDILLVDYRLEDGTGTRLVRDLRDQGLSAAVVPMTAHHQPASNE